MRTKGGFTLLVYAEGQSRVLRMRIPTWIALAAAVTLIGVLAASGWGLTRWLELRERKGDFGRLMSAHLRQKIELRKAANTLDRYESQLDDWQRFSTRLRMAYDLEADRPTPATYGIGGSLDEPPFDSRRGRDGQPQSMSPATIDKRSRTLAARAQRLVDDLDSLRTWSLDRRDRVRRTPHRSPLDGYVSSNFGYRRDPFTGRKGDLHSGMDVVAPRGTPIKAPADGIVTFAGRDPTLGKLVIIDHGYGIITRYGHNGKLAVQAGQRVERGEPIAWVGNTGRSTGPHLHYEVRVNDRAVNPQRFIVR